MENGRKVKSPTIVSMAKVEGIESRPLTQKLLALTSSMPFGTLQIATVLWSACNSKCRLLGLFHLRIRERMPNFAQAFL